MKWKGLLDIVYPRVCVCCNSPLMEPESQICTSCKLQLPIIQPDSEDSFILQSRFWGKVQIRQALALYKYHKSSSIQKMLKSIKYEKNKELAFQLGVSMGVSMIDSMYPQPDILIPVPLHPKKQKQRGFNQSKIIADGFSECTGIICNTEIVKRVVNTKTQTKLNREERWENVKSIFTVTDSKKIEGKNIAILDDVITTGSTVESLAEELMKHQPKSIQVLALAMAD